jgi:hypothetical protein
MVESSDIPRGPESAPPIERLAADFGISTEEASAAVDALMPGIAAAVKAKAGDPVGFLSLVGAPGAARPLAVFGDPDALPISDSERDALVARAAAATGLAPGLLSKILPVLGSLVVSAIVNYVQSRGLGGLGAILGQILGGGGAEASPVPPQGSPSGPGGIDLGAILEQIIRGGGGSASPVPPQGAPPSGPGGIDLSSILEQMIRGAGGSASPPAPGEAELPQGGLEGEIGKILRGGRG